MNPAALDKIVQAVLYEGYILYPYRRSVKNQHRWTFGSLFPKQYSDATDNSEPFLMQTQCLLQSTGPTELSIKVRFLQLVDRTVGTCSNEQATDFDPAPQIEVAGKLHQSWQEAIEQTVPLETSLSSSTTSTPFTFPPTRTIEPLHNEQGETVAALIRTTHSLQGSIELTITPTADNIHQLTLKIQNLSALPKQTQSRESAQLHSCASTHAILTTTHGSFISLIDPPPRYIPLIQTGAWPVLVGNPGDTDTLLASPIILYDYPQIAPESPGDLFDGCEIDEILSLRVLTLTDEEKRSASDLDPRAASLIGRTESLARDQLARLHGTMRPPNKVTAVHIRDAELHIGDHVRLAPTGRADAFDIILRGKTATIVAIEQDFENRLHLAVTVDDDPGADIGAAGKIGHRFFFRPEEVEPLSPAEAP